MELTKVTNTTIEEKYHIVYIGGKRYYEFDMTEKLPNLQETVPYLFRYKTIEIREAAWNRMTIGILNALDEQEPKSESELLSITYSWSKQRAFSKEKKTNHTKFKNLFLNTNHTSTHSMMSIQTLLQSYGIDLADCYFLIRRHPVSEPQEAREYFIKQTIDGLRFSMQAQRLKDEKVDKVIGIIHVLNKYLAKISSGFNNFFLFDDYYYFSNYKDKIVDLFKKRMSPDDKTLKKIIRCLKHLDHFYRNKDFYLWLKTATISDTFISILKNELEYLMFYLNSNFIVISKLYGRMMLLHRAEMVALGLENSIENLFNLCNILFHDCYYFQKPYISKSKLQETMNDEQLVYQYACSLDIFTISDLNKYIDQMHLKRVGSYLDLIIRCSNSHVQIDIDKMISKKRLDLNASAIEIFMKELQFYINSFGSIDSETYLGYNSLPSIGVTWNKYSLVGVIRSYCLDKFSITYKTKTYKKMHYVIGVLGNS